MIGPAWEQFASNLSPAAAADYGAPGEIARKYINEYMTVRTDPASKAPGSAPMYGQDAVPHILTFQSLVGTFSRAYLNPDEAIRDSIENAHLMRKDVGILECVENRQRLTALLDWEILPEDDSNPYQVALAREMKRIIDRIPRFTNYKFWLMDAIWTGRSGIQHRYGYDLVNGRMRCFPKPVNRDYIGWLPINGDKILYRYDDGSRQVDRGRQDAYPHQMGLKVSTTFHQHERIGQHLRIEPVGDGLATFLQPWERDTFVVHKHFIEDADFHYAWFAGSIHGVGIRSRIYWEWFLKQEAFAFLMQYLERSAGGIEVWTYPAGDDHALAKCQQAASEKMANGRNMVFFPRPLGEDGPMYDFQVIEPGAVGLDIIQNIVERYFGGRIKRYILGQELSTESHATGLGSGVADAHMDTLAQVVQFDARNLEETLTYELLRYLQKINFPETMEWHLRFRLKTETDDAKKRLDTLQAAWSMNAGIPESEVLKAAGVSAPKQGDKILQQNPQPPGFSAGGDPSMDMMISQMLEGNEQFQRLGDVDKYAQSQMMMDFESAAPGSGGQLFGGAPTSRGGQRLINWDESAVNREQTAHGDKKPGEFAPKSSPAAPPSDASLGGLFAQATQQSPQTGTAITPKPHHKPPRGWEEAAAAAFPPPAPPPQAAPVPDSMFELPPEEPVSEQDSDPAESVLAAIQDVAANDRRGGTILTIDSIRSHPSVFHLSKPEFDQAMLALRRRGDIQMDRHDNPDAVPDQKAWMVEQEPTDLQRSLGGHRDSQSSFYNTVSLSSQPPVSRDTESEQPASEEPSQPLDRNELMAQGYEYADEAVRIMAGKYGIRDEDIQTTGITDGLMKASETFDPSRGYDFKNYVISGMVQAARNALKKEAVQHRYVSTELGQGADGEQRSISDFGESSTQYREGSDPSDLAISSEQQQLIDSALASLDPDDAQFFRDIVLREGSLEDAGSEYGMARQATRGRLDRIRRQLQQNVSPEQYQAVRSLVVRYYMLTFSPQEIRERYQRFIARRAAGDA